MHFLVYQKKIDNYRDEPDLICRSFADRKELLQWCIDNGFKLIRERTLIINGDTGLERGTFDAHGELEELEVADVKEG